VAARAFHALLQGRVAAKGFLCAARFPIRRAAASGVIDPQKACPRRYDVIEGGLIFRRALLTEQATILNAGHPVRAQLKGQ